MAPQADSARVVGRYEVLDEIAAGGMATVHLGRVLGQGSSDAPRFVAIKRMHGQYGRDADFRSMFLDEARLAARIQHPNVVPTLDVVEAGGELLLVMELIDGESLSRLAKLATARGERVPVPIVASIVRGMLNGLHAAHEAVSETGEPMLMVHRDVSPHNVMVGSDGVARVLDFGVAKARGRMQQTQQGQIKGKLAYMSPEQARGKEVDRRSDVFASGIVLWELLLGKRLFEGENEASVLAQLLTEKPKPLSEIDPKMAPYEALVSRALDVEPTERFMTALELAAAIEKVMPVATTAEVAAWVRSEAGALLDKRAALIEKHLAFSKRSDFDDTPHIEDSAFEGLVPGLTTTVPSNPATSTPRVPAPRGSSSGGSSSGSAPSPPPRPHKPTMRLAPPRPQGVRASDPPAESVSGVQRGGTDPPAAPAFGPPPVFAKAAPPAAAIDPSTTAPGGDPVDADPLGFTMPLAPDLGTPMPGLSGAPFIHGTNPLPSAEPSQRSSASSAAPAPAWPIDFSDASGSFKGAAYGTTLLPAVTGPPPGISTGDVPVLGPPVPRPSDAPPAQSQVTSVTLTTTDLPPPLPKERVRQLFVLGVSTATVVAMAFGALLVIVSKHPWDRAHSQRATGGITRWAASTKAVLPKLTPPPPTPVPDTVPSATTSASPSSSAAVPSAPGAAPSGGVPAPRPTVSGPMPKPPSSSSKSPAWPTPSSSSKTAKPKK